MTKGQLMDRIGYSNPRTLERDLSFLRDEYAVDIIYDRSTRQYIFNGRGKFLVSTTLTEREVTAMAAGLRMAAHFLPHLQEPSRDLWSKIKGVLPEGLPEKGEKLALSSVVALPVSEMDSAVFETLVNAVNDRKTVRLRYCSPYGDCEPREHVVCPWGMYFRAHAWYLWSWCCEKEHPITLRIGRISSIVAYGTPPFVDPPESMDVQTWASSAWYGCAGDEIYKVKIEVEPPLATVVGETVWHPTQNIEQKKDGSIFLTATVPDLGDVARWVLASSPYAKVVEPPELKSQIRELSRKTFEKHESKTT
jgi:predicted DNA-binding transcriptional regulator YafY